MSTLADLVLSTEPEPDLEDAALAAELEQLRSLRSAAAQAAASRPASAAPRPSRPASAVPAEPVKTQQLADAILARADEAEDTIDKEIEEMDRQLQLQVESFRRQQRRDSTQDDVKAKPPSAAEGEEDEEEEGLPPEMPAPPEEVQELEQLKHLAAKMDEAFPEALPGSEPMPGALRFSKPTLIGGYQELPTDGPLDEEVSHFKGLLEHLDLRLRAIQSKQDLHPEETAEKSPADRPSATAVPSKVAELQMQNQVLRDFLANKHRRKGRLPLDRKVFGTATS